MSAHAHHRPDSKSPKHQAILDAAGDLFTHQGYGAVSMDSVARAAGVSKATLYAHFASKDRLFATIINQGCRQNIALADLLPPAGADLEAGLIALARRVMDFLLEDRVLAIYRIVIAECARFPELGRTFYENGPAVFIEVFSAWLREQAAAGHLAVPDPETAANQFIALLRTGAYLRATLGLAPPDSAEVEATAEAAVRTFLRAFASA